MLAQSDFVSIHCPRTRQTLGMIDARALARMKQGAFLVTTARGGIVDEAALFAALQSGKLSGAGVDVWDKEPPPLQHPLLTLETVIATYHTAGVTVEARRHMAGQAADQVVGLLKGGRPPRLVNPQAWPPIAPASRRLSECRFSPTAHSPNKLNCSLPCLGARKYAVESATCVVLRPSLAGHLEPPADHPGDKARCRSCACHRSS